MSLSVIEALWFGDFSESEAERRAATSMAAMSAKVSGMRSLPAFVYKVIELSRSPRAETTALAQIIEAEPSLAADLLRVVNSAAMGLRTRCTSVRHAVSLLGMRAIGEMALAMAALELYGDSSRTGLELALREHAAATGAVARQLAIRLALPIDDMYLCGLVHDLGKLLLLQHADEGYSAILRQCLHAADETHLAERAQLGFDHAVLAAHVLAAWEIPDPVPKVVAWHHTPARALQAGEPYAALVCVSRLADRIVHRLKAAVQTEDMVAGLARDLSAEYLDIEEDKLQDWWQELKAAAEEAMSLFRGHAASGAAVNRGQRANPPTVPPRPIHPARGVPLRSGEIRKARSS